MARNQAKITSPKSSYIRSMHSRDFGIALALLEGGRSKKEARIAPGVGLEFHKRFGDRVQTGEKLVTIHYNSEAWLAEAKKLVENGFVFGDDAPRLSPLIRQVIGG